MSRLLIVRPRTDGVEKSLSAWADQVLQTIASSPADFTHVEIDDLLGPGLTRDSVGKGLENASGVIYYGHGHPDSLGAPLLIDVDDAEAMIGGVIIAFACHAAARLGPDAVDAGVRCFLGFTDAFVVVNDVAQAPWSIWMEAAITGALMSQATVDDVHETLVSRFQWIFEAFKIGKYARTSNAPLQWMTADWNLRHLALIGDGTCAFV